MRINKNKSFGSLLDGVKSTQIKKHYVASAIFPVIITNQNDLHIVFFNYWRNKNKIDEKNLRVFTKIYDTEGNLVCHHGEKIFKYHNQLSIKNILKKYSKISDFIGSVNVEILSLEAISFPFPALTAIYNSKNIYSAIHSAGRLKNNVEPQEIMYTEESNWTCKFENSITPFFHYFVGNQTPYEKYITVKVFDRNNKVKAKKQVSIKDINPFGSKIFFINEIFKKNNFKKSDFITVKVEHNSVFPRMIVGNYHKKNNFYEASHSSPVVKKNYYIKKTNKYPFMSRIPLSKNKDLNLQCKIFPNTAGGDFNGETFVKKLNEEYCKKTSETYKFSRKNLSSVNVFNLKDDEELKSIKFNGKKVPDRLYTCNLYTVKNTKSEYSLDIAETSFASYYLKKFTHWGHGYIGEGYDTVIMVVNDDCEFERPKVIKGTLNVHSNNFSKKINVQIKGNSQLSLNLSKLHALKKLNKKKNFISWELKLKNPGCETKWVSYRNKDGSIFGDHGF